MMLLDFSNTPSIVSQYFKRPSNLFCRWKKLIFCFSKFRTIRKISISRKRVSGVNQCISGQSVPDVSGCTVKIFSSSNLYALYTVFRKFMQYVHQLVCQRRNQPFNGHSRLTLCLVSIHVPQTRVILFVATQR